MSAKPENHDNCDIIQRSEHNVSRSSVSENALKVLYRLKNAGFESYLVGGGVRDILLGRDPKDFDIATNATPEEVKGLFRNCRLIGRRFRLAHVHFSGDIIEVATFRGQHEGDQGDDGQIVDGMIVRDNVYGNLHDDAWRRDFTVNSLYYNIKDFSIVDYVGGLEDLKARRLSLIGEPDQRYREDPVRMLRAVRFAAKLNFTIEQESEAPLFELGELLEGVPPARLFEEFLKLFLSGHARDSYRLLQHYGLFRCLFPQTQGKLTETDCESFHQLIQQALENTDERIAQGKSVTPAFLLAVFLWGPVQDLRARYKERGMSEQQALTAAMDAVLSGQSRRISIPRRFQIPIKEIWNLQDRLARRAPKRSPRLLGHPRFRAAYDFLVLRAGAGGVEQELADWWTEFQEADEAQQETLLDAFKRRQRKPRRRKRRQS